MINPRRTWAIARKEFLHVLRDPRSLTMGIALPMVLLVLFAYALTLDVDRVPLAVWDLSRSHRSRELLSRFDASRYFTLVRHADNYRQLVEAIDRGEATVGLVIPPDFARRIDSGRTVPVQMIVDGSDSNTATLAIAYAETVTRSLSVQLASQHFRRTTGRQVALPVDMRLRVWFNEDLCSQNFIIPGLIAVIMMVVAALLTSLTVAREWERGTMEQLISTPVGVSELIFGKLVPYFCIAMFDVALAVWMGQYVFHVPLRGSAALLFAATAVFLSGALAQGMLISIVTKNQLLACQMAIITTFLPAFLLSGFVFAIENMPPMIQLVTFVVPARYFIAMLRGIYLKGVGVEVLAFQGVLLASFAVVMAVLARRKFQKRLD